MQKHSIFNKFREIFDKSKCRLSERKVSRIDRLARQDFEKNPEAFDKIKTSIIRYLFDYDSINYCENLMKELTIEFFKWRRSRDRLYNTSILTSHGQYTDEDVNCFIDAIVSVAVREKMMELASELDLGGPIPYRIPELSYTQYV